MKVGLFFGSFNPIHIGHLVIANYMSEFTDLDQVWLVVSPHNPLKDKKSLSAARKRLTTVQKAVGKNQKIKVSDVEFSLTQPSYTINTLEVLAKKYPKNKFVIIIGSDNLSTFRKWKEYKKILSKYKVYVYPRNGIATLTGFRTLSEFKAIKIINAPRIDISSTFIREQMKKGKDVRYLIPNNR